MGVITCQFLDMIAAHAPNAGDDFTRRFAPIGRYEMRQAFEKKAAVNQNGNTGCHRASLL
jgi:hypothetical protein